MARKREIAADTKRRTRKIVTPTAFSVQVDNYVAKCVERNLKQSTIDSYVFYLSYFKSYLASNNCPLLVDEITQTDVKGFFTFMRNARDNKQATINSAIASIRPFFTFLVSEEIIVESPMAKISKGKVDKNPIIPFTENELSRLLKEPNKSTFTGFRDYCLMLVLISTGVRISECLNLRINDVDYKNNRIIVTESKNRQPRIVGLASKLKPELQRFIRVCMNDCQPTDYLFQGQDGGQLKPRSIQQNIKEYGEQAKIDTTKRVSPHTFRHTYAISFLKNGGSTASLREQLGHLTITTVEKYLYWSTDEKLEQFQKYNPLDNMTLKI